MDESRKQFESVISGKGWSIQKTGIGDYVHERVQLMWMSWKESRAAIEIELPEADLVYSSATDQYGVEGVMMLPESLVERVLQAAGIKVKE